MKEEHEVYSGAENFASGNIQECINWRLPQVELKVLFQLDSPRKILTFTLAAKDLNSTINLDNISVGVFLTAMENVAALRAQNGATMSRLEFQEVNLSRQRSNMEAASWSDQGYRHGGRKYPNGKVQRIKAGVRGDACTGEHFPGSRPHAHPLTLTAINQPI